MRKFIAILLMTVFTISLCSCESIGEQIKEEAVEKLVEKVLGEEVEVTIVTPTANPETAEPESTDTGILDNIINNGEDISWPEEIPSNVPCANLKITSTVKTPNGIILDFGEVGISQVEEYAEMLKNSLYETIREDISEKIFDASYRKEETVANVYWYKGGTFSLMITW